QPKVVRADGIGLHLSASNYRADGRWPYEEVIIIKSDTWIVFIKVIAYLNRIARLEEILAIEIGDHHLLAPVAERVEAAIGILLHHRKIGRVVLITVRAEVAENASPRLLVEEDESAKIAVEGLRTEAGGNEIVVVRQVLDLGLDEGFLQPELGVDARRPRA